MVFRNYESCVSLSRGKKILYCQGRTETGGRLVKSEGMCQCEVQMKLHMLIFFVLLLILKAMEAGKKKRVKVIEVYIHERRPY